jgi:TonB family protein
MSNSLKHANSPSGAAPSPQLATPESDADVSAALRKRFDIVSRLAESDTHFVYSARDLSRPAVGPGATGLIRLKVLSTSLAGDSRQVELFRLEASAAARLSHANILKTTEAEELNGIHFSIMEEKPDLITLRDHLDRRGWLNAEEAAQISRQIADALQHAHSRSILHLTLEPEKVLLDHTGTAYVTGFGIDRAKDLLWARQERSRHCAARYIAPEQILSGEVDQRTDLYLLGLILFEMLTDRAPFESADLSDLKTKHLARTPAPPHTFRPELSKELSQTVMDLLNKRPDGRPFYISAFKSALDRCIAVGLITQEQDEDTEESDSLHESIPSSEDSDSPVQLATSDGGEQNFEADELGATGGAAVAVDEEFKDSDAFYQPDSTDVGYVKEFPEPDDGFGDSSLPHRNVIEIPLQNTREDEHGKYYEQRESMETAPVLLSEEPGKVKSGRLVWLVILLLIGGGLSWAILAARSQGKSNPAVSGGVTNLQSNDESSASNAEASVAKAEPVNSGAAEELPSDSALANLVTEDALTDTEKSDTEKSDPVTTPQAKPTHKVEAEKSSPPERAENAPPVISPAVPVFTPETDSPAKLKEYAPDNVQPREPAPAPQQPDRSPDLKTIRKSGDVLQNTAIIRHRPLYPKAARASNVKGAVTIEVTIDEEGSVIAARPISGPEQLRDAALAAARRWKWVPERVDRNRARVVGTITLSFKD